MLQHNALRMKRLHTTMLVALTSLAGRAQADIASPPNRTEDAVPWYPTTNNVVTSSIAPGKANWDPADPFTISGTLWDIGAEICERSSFKLTNIDQVVVTINSNPDGEASGQHERCDGVTQWTVTPGTDANGNFSITIPKGGGCSWLSGDGVTSRKSWIHLLFKEGSAEYNVACGDGSTYQLPGCA